MVLSVEDSAVNKMTSLPSWRFSSITVERYYEKNVINALKRNQNQSKRLETGCYFTLLVRAGSLEQMTFKYDMKQVIQ